MNAIYTQLVLRMRLVVVELVDAYRREHRVEDRELARREAADHDAPRAEALRRELVRNSGRSRVLLRRACLLSEFSSLQLGGLRS